MPLVTREFLTELDDGPGLKHLAKHLSLIFLFGLLIYLKIPGWPVLLLPQGIIVVFLFTLLHETIHQTPFRTRWLNNVVAYFCGFILFLPPTWFKYFHFAHHRYTQVPGKDPELEVEKPDSWSSYIWHVSGIPTWYGHFKILFKNSLRYYDTDFIPNKKGNRIIWESRLLIIVYGLIFFIAYGFGSYFLFWVWIFPLLFGQPFLRFYLLAEHGLCPYVSNMLENTRTTFTNRFIMFIAWNMPLHIEHHTYPTVPFHKLPELNKLMTQHLLNTKDGYLSFNKDYVKSIDGKS